jgi:acylphosphatase
MSEDAVQVRHVFVEGYVQGVGLREFVRRSASQLNLSGWVRNRRNGEVEALIIGAAGNVEALLTRMRVGPWGSEVTGLRVEARDFAEVEETGAFVVRPTPS